MTPLAISSSVEDKSKRARPLARLITGWMLVGWVGEEGDGEVGEGDGGFGGAVEEVGHGSGERDGLGIGGKIDEDVDGGARTLAERDFDAGGDVGDGCGDAAVGEHPVGGGVHGFGIEPSADVGDASVADFASECGGLVVEPAVGFTVAKKDFGVGSGGGEVFGPEGGFAVAPLPFHGNGRDERVVLLDVCAEKIGERAGLTGRLEAVVVVLHGGALAENEVTAIADVGGEIAGGGFGEDIEAGSDDEFVRRKIGGGRDDVDGLRERTKSGVVGVE